MTGSKAAEVFRPRFLGALAPLAVLGLMGLTLLLLMRLGVVGQAAGDPFPLLPILNVLLISLVSMIVARIALRSYVATGLLNALFLGTAVIPSGVGALIAGLLVHIPGKINVAVTSHNFGMFLSALIHFAGALLVYFRSDRMVRTRNRRLVAWTAYLLVALIVTSAYLASRAGRSPLFFTPEHGGTLLRKITLAVAIAFYLASGLLFMSNGRWGRVEFLFWYALALFAMGAGLLIISMAPIVGGVVSWCGRAFQYVSGIYFLIAVWSTVRTTRYRGISLERSIAGFFQESRAFFRDVFDALSDAVIAVDRGDRVVLWNDAACSLFGYSRKEAMGARLSRLVLDRGAAEADLVGSWARTKARREPEEITFRCKNGELFTGELTHSRRDTAVGKMDILVVRDVSERRRHEILRLEQHKLLEAVLGQAPDAIVVYDTEGKLLFLNQAARALGLEEHARSGEGFAAFDSICLAEKKPGNRQSSQQKFRDVLAGKDVCPFEAQVRRRGGAVDLLVSAAPLHSQDGRIIGATAVLSDVTALKTMEEQLRRRAAELERVNLELEEFTYVSSHDLKEPLRTIVNYIQILQADYGNRLDGEAGQIMAGVVGAAGRMRRLIGDLLMYSRAGKEKRRTSSADLKPVLDQVLLNLRGTMEKLGARVESGDLPAVHADSTELSQLFQNLIANSLKYRGEEPPKIRIWFEPHDDGMVLIGLRDNGIGIAARHHQRIFRAFQRLHGRGRYEGTGIGLAICKKVVEGYGGRIWVESTPGSGSTFYFTLPAKGENDG